MEPVVTGAIAAVKKESAEVLEKEAKSFLGAVLGGMFVEPARGIGGLLGDKINARRHTNLINITVEAKRKLAEAGVSPKEVPLSIIHPALEAASLEEDPTLQKTWANLLANAADPRSVNPVAPSFVFILKELGSREVKFLETLYTNTEGVAGLPYSVHLIEDIQYTRNELIDLYAKAGLSRELQLTMITVQYWKDHEETISADMQDFKFTLGVIRRHGLLEETVASAPVNFEQPPNNVKIDIRVTYSFSNFGLTFVRACRTLKGI